MSASPTATATDELVWVVEQVEIPEPRENRHAVLGLDTTSGAEVSRFDVSSFAPPFTSADSLAVHDGVAWIMANTFTTTADSFERGYELLRLDLATGDLVSAGEIGEHDPNEETVLIADGHVWAVTYDGIVRVDPGTGELTEIPLPDGAAGVQTGEIAAGGDYVWIVLGQTLLRVDTASGDTTEFEVPTTADDREVAADDTGVWLFDYEFNPEPAPGHFEPVIRRIDPEDGTVTATAPFTEDTTNVVLRARGGRLYVIDNGASVVSIHDGTTLEQLARSPAVSGRPLRAAVDDRFLWVTSHPDALVHLDASTGEILGEFTVTGARGIAFATP